MQFSARAKRIVWIVGSLAFVLLAVLLFVFLKYGNKKKEEPLDVNMLALKGIELQPFDTADPVLDAEVMEEYDFTVLEVWYPQSADCVRYMSEMNMFAEECLHRDDEMYANVVGVCIKCNDKTGKTDAAAVEKAAEIARGEDVLYHQYVADAATEKELEKLTSKVYPTVIYLNRQGEIIRIVSGRNGKELCDCLDELIDITMKEKKAKEKEERKKE
jgi:hypothetical protein